MTTGPDLEWTCLMYRLIIICKIYACLDEGKIYFQLNPALLLRVV